MDFEPSIAIGIAHIDNVNLAADGDEQGETVYQLIPAFGLSQAGPRFSTNVEYRMEGYRYQDIGETDSHHLLDAAFHAALEPDNFFLDFGASRTQSITDPEAPIPRGNLPRTSNRIDRDESYFGPSFQFAIGANLTTRGSYRRTWVRYEDGDVPGIFVRDFDAESAAWSIDNYRRARGLTWAARYTSNETDYGIFMPWENRRASVEMGAWVSQGLRLFATAGKESPWDRPFDSSLEDDFWELGIATPTGERFSAEFAAGERGFGATRRGSLGFAFQRGRTNLNYAERVTTQGLNPFRRGLLTPEEFEDYLSGPGTQRYISKRLQWSLGFDFRRSGISLALFDEDRERIVELDGTAVNDQTQSGAVLQAFWQAGARTELSASLRRAERSFSETGERRYTSAAVTADYQLGSRTYLSLEYVRTKEETEGEILGRKYSANLVSLLLTRTF